jgi:protein-disulfide isomerase
MTEASTQSRLPLLAAMSAVALLAAVGGYLYFQQVKTGETSAAKAAESAIAAAGMSDADRKATEAVVRAYILENPEILREAAEVLQDRETAKRVAAASSSLTKPFPGAVAGNPQGDVTLVEFTDYSCGFCRASVADVQKLIDADKGVRVIYREVPILSPASKLAAQWGLAAARQGKHKVFHDAMFAGDKPSEASVRVAAQKAGLDMTRAAKDANSPEVLAELEANLGLMQQIGVNGTPTFVVGNTILEGALGHDALKEAVAKARKAG